MSSDAQAPATVTGLSLDDAALSIARDGVLESALPSIVETAIGPSSRLGQPASPAVRATATAVSSRHWFDVAHGRPPAPPSIAVARAELAVRLGDNTSTDADARRVGGSLQVAVPAAFDAGALSRVLALCNTLALPVAGFVDAAALTVAALGLHGGAAIVLEIGLHHVGATRLDVGGGEARRRSARVRTRGGLFGLQDSWLQLVSEAAVLRTRFDPLHDPAMERRLYEQLPELATRAAREGSVTVELEANGVRHDVTLSRDQFAARGEALYRDLVAMIHELRPAGAPITLVASELCVDLPGLREALDEFRGCALIEVPEGFAAVAASLLPPAARAVRDTDDGRVTVRLARGVARFETPPLAEQTRSMRLGGATAADSEVPTHLLWAGRALPLRGASLQIGRDPGPGGIALADGLAGISRLHCTLRDDDGAIMIVDHSRHGTWVNGERVAGRARLRAGDRVRLGDPGVELALIAVG